MNPYKNPYVYIYLGAAIAANLIIAKFGPAAAILVAFFLIGLDITSRDRLHDLWSGRQLPLRMGALILAGSLASWLINAGAGRIGLASFIAFAAAGLADALVYHKLRSRSWLKRVNGSNLASALVDSLVFPTLAFGQLLPAIIVGQFAAKFFGGAVWSLVIRSGKHNEI